LRNRNASILLRGSAIFLLIIATFLTISALIGYSRQRNNYPAGMTIAGFLLADSIPRMPQRVLAGLYLPVEIILRYRADPG
jgi:hypothetical protein